MIGVWGEEDKGCDDRVWRRTRGSEIHEREREEGTGGYECVGQCGVLSVERVRERDTRYGGGGPVAA